MNAVGKNVEDSSNVVVTSSSTKTKGNIPEPPTNHNSLTQQIHRSFFYGLPSHDHYSNAGYSKGAHNNLTVTSASLKRLQCIAQMQTHNPSKISKSDLKFHGCNRISDFEKKSVVHITEPTVLQTQESSIKQELNTTSGIRFPGKNQDNLRSKAIDRYSKRREKTQTVKIKDEKYWQRRIRNNLAAKKSRDLKREKEKCTEQRITSLEIENRRLRLELSCLMLENQNFRQIIEASCKRNLRF